MTLRARLHRLALRLFGSPTEGFPDPPHERHLAQLAHAHRVAHGRGVAVTQEDLAEMLDAAWQEGFRAGWVHEEREYWREHGELPEEAE